MCLANIDTPELRGAEREEGLRYKERVIGWFERHDGHCLVETTKTGKYGRWIGTICAVNEKNGEKDHLEIYLLWLMGKTGGNSEGKKNRGNNSA